MNERKELLHKLIADLHMAVLNIEASVECVSIEIRDLRAVAIPSVRKTFPERGCYAEEFSCVSRDDAGAPQLAGYSICARRLAMNESLTGARTAVLFAAIGLLALMLTSTYAHAGDSHRTCSNATMHGTYVYAYNGHTGTGSALTRFAVAGLAVFNGNGTSHGVWTIATESQPAARLETFQGTYSLNSDCTATEVDTDQNGNVFHYDDFTGPGGKEISFVQTDPNVVSSGTETRMRKNTLH